MGFQWSLAEIAGAPHRVYFDETLYSRVVMFPFGLMDYGGMGAADHLFVAVEVGPDLVQGIGRVMIAAQ